MDEKERTEEQQQVIEALVQLDIASIKVGKFTFMTETERLWLQSQLSNFAARLLAVPNDDDQDRPARAEIYEGIRRRSLSRATLASRYRGRVQKRRAS